MPMNESCLKRLRAFRGSVHRVLVVVREEKPFATLEAGRIPEWEDLDHLVDAVVEAASEKDGVRMPYKYAVAIAIKRALEGFNGKGKLSSVTGIRNYLEYIRDEKLSGGYRRGADLLFFLERLRRIVANKINTQRRDIRRKANHG